MQLAEGHRSTESFDVVVVGSGAAGLGAAIVAASKGLSVVVVERAPVLGGTTATSGGGVWIPGNSFMRAAGDNDTPAAALEYLRGLVAADRSTDLMSAFLENGPRALDYFQTHSELTFSTRRYSPDYYSNHASAARTSRAVDSAEYDGRKLKTDLRRLRQQRPESFLFSDLALSGADIGHLRSVFKSFRSLRHVARLIARFAWQHARYGRSTRLVLGRAMIGRMLVTLRDLNVEIRDSCAALEVVLDGDRADSLQVDWGGRVMKLRARKGIVLAAGGFGQSDALRSRWVPHPDRHVAVGVAETDGAGIELGVSAGGGLPEDSRDSAYWTPVSTWTQRDGRTAAFPHLVTDRAKPGVIAVRGDGRRFVNEASSYHDFVRAMFETSDGRPARTYLLCDNVALRRYGLGFARPWPFPKRRFIRDGYLIRAGSLKGLARKLSIDPIVLLATVSRYNADAEAGIDKEFGKGSTAYNRHMGDALHAPNPCLASIVRAPFYAVELVAGNVGTSRGLQVNADAQVLDGRNSPIKGLYAVGNDADSVLAGSYPGPGASLGPALTGAFVAGSHMAASGSGPAA